MIWLGQLFGRLTVRDTSPYKYKGVSVPCLKYNRLSTSCDKLFVHTGIPHYLRKLHS